MEPEHRPSLEQVLIDQVEVIPAGVDLLEELLAAQRPEHLVADRRGAPLVRHEAAVGRIAAELEAGTRLRGVSFGGNDFGRAIWGVVDVVGDMGTSGVKVEMELGDTVDGAEGIGSCEIVGTTPCR